MRTTWYEIEDDAILADYFSGHISARDLFYSERRKLCSFIGLGMMIRTMKWAMNAKNEYDAIWWGRLRLLLNQAAESTIDEMDALPSRLRSNSRSDLKRLRHNLAKTGGCVTIDLLPDNIIAAGPVAVERKFEAGLLLGFGPLPSSTLYPIMQFNDSGSPVHGVRQVFDAFYRNVVHTINFLVEEHEDLGGKAPITCLKEKAVRPVLRLARKAADEGQ